MGSVATLKDLLTAVVFGGAAPLITYQLCKWILTKKPDWSFLTDRIVSLVIAGVIALVAWGIGVWLQYFALPAPTPRDWLEAIFVVVFPVFAVSQLGHAYVTKVERDKAKLAS